jgi:nitrite reductase (NADH) small subunit
MSVAARLPLAMDADVVADQAEWIDVCALDDIRPKAAVCALVGRRQVAIFRPGTAPALYALDNIDPFSQASVLSRGIMGDRNGVPKIASPIFKQSFDLRTGICLDDAAVRVAAFPVRVRDGRVQVKVDVQLDSPSVTK